jgi:hypothetical protein
MRRANAVQQGGPAPKENAAMERRMARASSPEALRLNRRITRRCAVRRSVPFGCGRRKEEEGASRADTTTGSGEVWPRLFDNSLTVVPAKAGTHTA